MSFVELPFVFFVAPPSDDETLQPLAQGQASEVHQQPGANPGRLEIRQKLRLVDRSQCLHGLDLDDHAVVDNTVDSLNGHRGLSVSNDKRLLDLERNLPILQL